jgi:hypothetical protein
MGRWTFTKFMGRAEKVITIISVYQVCNNNRSSTTAYHQQQSALIQHGTSNPKPRKQFQNDLHQFLRTSQSNGESIILVGDFIMRTLTSAHPAQLRYAKTMAWLIYLQHGILTSRNLDSRYQTHRLLPHIQHKVYRGHDSPPH